MRSLTQLKQLFRQKVKVLVGGPANLTRGQGLLEVLDALAEEIKQGGATAIALAAAQQLLVATPPAVGANVLYSIIGTWNGAATNSTVFVQGVRPNAFHRLGMIYDAQDIGQLVEVDVVAGTYEKLAAYDDTNIYALARAIRDRVDALDRNVIRWNQPRRITIPSGGGNPGYESGDAFVVYASSTSSSSNIFKFNAPDYPRQGDLVAVRVRADSVVFDIRGLRFGSPTGPTSFAGQPGQQYVFHAATDTPGDVTATYWVVHSTPSSSPITAPTPVPFGPLTASGAAGETFPLPAGTQSVRSVQVLDANPKVGVHPVLGFVSGMYILDTSVTPPTLSIKAPYTLDAGDIIEGIAFTTGGTTTPTPGAPGIAVGGTQGSDSITVISTSAA